MAYLNLTSPEPCARCGEDAPVIEAPPGPDLYVVSCPNCAEADDCISAKGTTRVQAVAKWNDLMADMAQGEARPEPDSA